MSPVCRLTIFSLFLLLMPIALLPVSVVGKDERELFGDVFGDYAAATRPKKDSSQPVILTVNIYIKQLEQIVERSQIHRIIAMLEAAWVDDFIQWDPAEYDNITEIVIPPEQIWLPDVGIRNSVGTFYQDIYYEHFRVLVKHTGEAMWSIGGLFETTCIIDTTFYPFDTQFCPIVIENWAYHKMAVGLINNTDKVLHDNYIPHGLWTLAGSKITYQDISFELTSNILFPQMNFTLEWHRKPQYYIVNIVLPCVFLLSIALLSFWLPPSAGEKVSLGVTILLAFSVFQVVISNNTPENSDKTPLLSIFVSVTMGLSTISVVTTILVLYLHHKSPSLRPPRMLKFFVCKILARVVCLRINLPDTDDVELNDIKRSQQLVFEADYAGSVDLSPINENNIDSESKNEGKKNNVKFEKEETNHDKRTLHGGLYREELQTIRSQMDVVTDQLRLMTSRIKNKERESVVMQEWQAVAKVIDRLCFWLVIILLSISLIWMFTTFLSDTN